MNIIFYIQCYTRYFDLNSFLLFSIRYLSGVHMYLSPDEKVNLSDGKWEDIHVTTGALKMLFRELPEPLFTYSLFNDFVSAISMCLCICK